jgi:hypothetical protein
VLFNAMKREEPSIEERMAATLVPQEDLRLFGVPWGRVQTWRKVRAKKFPRPVKVGSRNAWVRTEVIAFVEKLKTKR